MLASQWPCGVRSAVGLLVGGRLFRRSERSWMEVAEDSERLGAGFEEDGRSGKVCVTIATTTNLSRFGKLSPIPPI